MLKSTALLASLLVAACTTTSSRGQAITCDTDPETGVVTRCEPSDGTPPGPGQCTDIDEDGDGKPGDDDGTPDQGGDNDDDEPGDDNGSGSGSGGGSDDAPPTGRSGDSDDDGIDDSEDCDEQTGEDDDDADLPYNIKLPLGQATRPIIDAFAEKGAQPAAIVSVEFDGGAGWRAAELSAGTEFTVDQADCDHEGNRGTGRDRVVVTWERADGSTDSDHLEIRYCED